MFRYKIVFQDAGGKEYADAYISMSVFATRHDAALAGIDYCRRYREAYPKAICKWQIVGI